MDIDFEQVQRALAYVIGGIVVTLCATGIVAILFPIKTRKDRTDG